MKSTIKRTYMIAVQTIGEGRSITDCNNAVDPNFEYQVESTALNKPASYCHMVVYQTGWGYAQLAMRYNGDAMYFRTKGNGVWSAWKTISMA